MLHGLPSARASIVILKLLLTPGTTLVGPISAITMRDQAQYLLILLLIIGAVYGSGSWLRWAGTPRFTSPTLRYSRAAQKGASNLKRRSSRRDSNGFDNTEALESPKSTALQLKNV